MRLLVADDDELMRELLAAVFAAQGHAVETFPDGKAAWQAFERLPADLVVLDWEMPVLDGLEVCRRIRAHPAGADTYLLVVTVRGGMADLDQVLGAGADDYVAKPVTPDELMARLRIAERRIEVARARRRAEAELQKARWLAGVGELSLALQHEINNPLAALLTNASLVSAGMLDEAELKVSLATIDAQARRIAAVVKRLNGMEDARSVEYLQGGQRMVDLGSGAHRPERRRPDGEEER